MNPWGVIIIGLGIILIYIGWKGSQHSVINSFKGIRGGGKPQAPQPQGGGKAPPGHTIAPGPAPQQGRHI